eukprot:6211940-Pleurochrysis_carterae.AAC.1
MTYRHGCSHLAKKSHHIHKNSPADVVLVNLHGGCPHSLWRLAFSELESLRHLRDTSTVYTNVASGSTVPEASLFELISGGAKHNITDCLGRQRVEDHDPSLSLFHQFKSTSNYNVFLKGCFGIDPSLNPFKNPRQLPDASGQLKAYGVDEFEPYDSAFTCQSSYTHDILVLQRVLSTLRQAHARRGTSPSGTPLFMLVNLLACRDAGRSFQVPRTGDRPDGKIGPFMEATREDGETNVTPGIIDGNNDLPCLPSFSSENSSSACEKDNEALYTTLDYSHNSTISSKAFHLKMARAHSISALRARTLTHDPSSWCTQSCESVDECTQAKEVAWRAMQEVDTHVAEMLKMLPVGSLLVVMADQGLSLDKEGCMRHGPWDTCLHTSMIVHRVGNTYDQCKTISTPTSCAEILYIISDELCIDIVHPRALLYGHQLRSTATQSSTVDSVGCIITLSVPPSQICTRFALRTLGEAIPDAHEYA